MTLNELIERLKDLRVYGDIIVEVNGYEYFGLGYDSIDNIIYIES